MRYVYVLEMKTKNSKWFATRFAYTNFLKSKKALKSPLFETLFPESVAFRLIKYLPEYRVVAQREK